MSHNKWDTYYSYLDLNYLFLTLGPSHPVGLILLFVLKSVFDNDPRNFDNIDDLKFVYIWKVFTKLAIFKVQKLYIQEISIDFP